MRKEALDDRYRVRLGPKATDLAKAHCPPADIPGAEHLEKAIEVLVMQVETLSAQNTTLQSVIDGFGYRMDNLTDRQSIANRALIMMMGQCVRELDAMRTVLVAMQATSPEEAQKLLEYGAYFITRMRATLETWRDREGIAVPDYELRQEEKMLDALNAPAKTRDKQRDIGGDRERD